MIKDPYILLSFINTKLRDFYESFDSLCSDLDLDKEEVERILASIDYYYDSQTNTFRILKSSND